MNQGMGKNPYGVYIGLSCHPWDAILRDIFKRWLHPLHEPAVVGSFHVSFKKFSLIPIGARSFFVFEVQTCNYDKNFDAKFLIPLVPIDLFIMNMRM